MPAKITMNDLIEEFRAAALHTQGLRFRLGDIVIRMLEFVTIKQACSEIKHAIPNAQALLGYAVTVNTLTQLANAARTFAADGAFVSEDGYHRVTRDDIQALGLTPAQASGLADRLRSQEIKVKPIAHAVKQVRKHGADTAEGKPSVERVRAMIAKGTDKAPTVKSVHQLAEELEAVRKRIAKLQEQERSLVKAIKDANDVRKTVAPVEQAPTTRPQAARGTGKSQPQLSA